LLIDTQVSPVLLLWEMLPLFWFFCVFYKFSTEVRTGQKCRRTDRQ